MSVLPPPAPAAEPLGLFRSIPILLVDLDGRRLSASESAGLVGIRVQQRCNLPALCEIVLAGQPGPVPDVDLGTTLRITVEGHRAGLFDGEVTAVEHVHAADSGHEVRVRAYDALHRLRKTRQVRARVDVTPARLAEELGGSVGLGVSAAVDGPPWARLLQRGESDLGLLTRVAGDAGLWFTVTSGSLELFDSTGSGPVVPLSLGSTLQEARIDINGDPACDVVRGTGWNAVLAEPHDAEVSTPRSGRAVAASADAGAFGGDGVVHLVDQDVHDEAQLSARLQARLDRETARAVTFWGVAGGDPALHPGVVIEVKGVAPVVAGRYVVTSVDHVVDNRLGYVCEVSTTPPDRPEPTAPGPVAALGRVTSVDDPDRLGRVQVALPTLGDAEAGWMPILSVGAGSGKGLVWLPDTDDLVLVLAPSGDLTNAVIVGGLYAPGGPADPGVVDGAVRRYSLTSAGGQKVCVDDSAKTVRLEDATGSFLELGPDQVVVHAAADLLLDAPGRGVRIRARAIDFETAT